MATLRAVVNMRCDLLERFVHMVGRGHLSAIVQSI